MDMKTKLELLREAALAGTQETEAEEETRGVQIARENRALCNSLTDPQRGQLTDIAMAFIYGSNVPSFVPTRCS